MQFEELWEAVTALQTDAKLQRAESTRATTGLLQRYAALLPLPSKASPALSASLATAACDFPYLQGRHGQLLPAKVIGHSSIAGLDHILMKVYFFVSRFLKPPSTAMVSPQARYLVSAAPHPFKSCFAMQMDLPSSPPAYHSEDPSDIAALNSSETKITAYVDVEIDLRTPGVLVQPGSSHDRYGEQGGGSEGGYRLTGLTLVHAEAALLSSDKALQRFKILLETHVPGEGGAPAFTAWELLGELEMGAPRNSSQADTCVGDTCVGEASLSDGDDPMGRCQSYKLKVPAVHSQGHPSKCRLRIVALSNHGGHSITCMPQLLFHGERLA
eukprot:gene13450-19308_t